MQSETKVYWPVALFFVRVAAILHQGSVTFANGDLRLLTLPLDIAQTLFLWRFLRARRDWLLLANIVIDVVGWCTYVLGFHGFLPLPARQATLTVALALMYALVAARILISLRAGSRDARLLLLPIVLQGAEVCIDGVRQAIYWAGRSHNSDPLLLWSNDIVAVAWSDVFSVLYLVAIAAGLILRFTRSAREEKRLATELASARAVQDHLVPVQLPALPGLDLGAAYIPAAEVGGDFHQIFRRTMALH